MILNQEVWICEVQSSITCFGVTETAAAGAAAASAASAASTTAAAAATATTLADVGLYAGLASSVIGGLGAFQSGRASAAAATYNSQVSEQNAQLAQQNAKWATEAGEAKVEQQGAKTRAQVGGILAAQAANNVDVTKGSAVDVRSSAASLGELSAINIRSDAARQAYGLESQASSASAQSQLDKMEAGQDEIAGEVGGASSVIGGVGTAASNYGKFLNQNSNIVS